MIEITLHNLFCHLINDDKFLSTVIETDNKDLEHKKNKKKGFQLTNLVTEYSTLPPFEAQSCSMFPTNVKYYLQNGYIRYGIKNVMDKNLNILNISFLNSLNILLRPEICDLNLDEQIKNLIDLEEFVIHMIHRCYQIDKVKRTKKIKNINKEHIKNLSEGKFTHDLIQTIINIFEINLLVFDLITLETFFYWSNGNKYPFFNPFKDIYCMSYIHGNYEPIIAPNVLMMEEKQKIYEKIIISSDNIKCIPKIHISSYAMIYINSWKINNKSYIKICDIYLKKNKFDPEKCVIELKASEKKLKKDRERDAKKKSNY